MEYCDMNGDYVLTVCEVHDCVVMCENEWRVENCPDNMEPLYCSCPFAQEEPSCEGAWTCDDIYYITTDVMAYWDTNSDGSISYEDNISAEDMDAINYYCDYNGDNEVDICEVHQCIVDYEN